MAGTIGELYDRLKEIAKVENELEYYESSLAHGGSPQTMKSKAANVKHTKDWLNSLRDELIDPLPDIDPALEKELSEIDIYG